MNPISSQNFSHEAEKWMLQPQNTQVNAPTPFDLSPSRGTRNAKDAGKGGAKKNKPGDPRFPQLRQEENTDET